MNAKRRKAIEQIMEQLRELADEERNAFDNMPEGIQASERGQAVEENADLIENAISELESVQ